MEEGRTDAQESRWGSVLEIMLESDAVCAKICEGEYVEKLGMLMENEGLANVIYRSIIDKPKILTGIAGLSTEPAKEIVNRFIEGGYWLCWEEDELDEIVGSSQRGIEEIRHIYLRNESAELSIMELRAKAKNGELDGLIEGLMNRLLNSLMYHGI